ncbi:hypothetical protein OH76DRAFT_1482551 [Lentinus brumalis]|uniref:Uncharacterized protein n=1 Tax=Lentinus brumalis TaxID=2498619 RepID=A0A371DBZ7_9APHY|nr:hypothetical protein OH76DRAFT_1482551 [Polyporus brumalis]
MDWWSLFRKVRKVIFAFTAVTSLIWAIILSLYLSKEWNYFSILQRSIVLSLIGVNGVTALLLYLMIVVVFRMWKELVRIVFLLAIHIGTAVPFTLYGVRFSCNIFDTQLTCKIVDLAFLATAWSITGLILGYTIYLCIMSRVHRPFPLITPNDLITGSTPSVSRSPSMSSVNSRTGLLARDTNGRSSGPASIRSAHSPASGRTVPKRMFTAINGAASHPEDAHGRVRREQQIRRGQSYGAMGSPQHPRPSVGPILQSRFSGSTIASTRSFDSPPPRAVSPVQSSVMSTLSRQSSAATTVTPQRQPQNVFRAPHRPLLLNPNPFMDPLSRHGTPETALSGVSYSSAPGNLNLGHMAAYSPFAQPYAYSGYLGPYSASTSAGVPPQLQPGARPDVTHLADPFADPHPHARSASSSPQYMTSMGPHISYAASPVGPPPRMHNATPSNASIHSMAPSLHFTNEHGHPIPGAAAHGQGQGSMHLPASAHMRMASDPVWRPYSAGARLSGPYDDVELPNPYNRGAEIRRYGSVPHVRSGSYGAPAYGGYGYGNGYVTYAPVGYMGQDMRSGGRGAANDARWREVVMRAAATP